MSDTPTPHNPLAFVPLYLPSKGMPYDGKIPEGKVEGRKMTVSEIADFESHGGSAHDKIDRLLASCSRLPNGVKHNELLLTDRMALMLALRKITLGVAYNYEFKCRYCGHVNKRQCDLSTDLQLREPPEEWQEPFPVDLPDIQKTVMVRFLRGRDEEAVSKYAARMSKAGGHGASDPSLPYRLALQIEEIDGQKLNVLERERFAKNMTLQDLNVLADAVEQRESGIDPDMTVECTKCSSPNDVTWEMTAEFFRPTHR